MKNKVKPYLFLSFIITAIFVLLLISLSVFPFGKNTLLTIDLSQQYLDFFALYKHTLLNDPSQFFYSFEKAYGGEMLGLWTYYLMSPFNLILLFFEDAQINIAVTIIIYLKFLAMSFTFYYAIQKLYVIKNLPSIIFTICYTFMSYSITYMLNIMWLDGLILLPLIYLGIQQLITTSKRKLYIISLCLMIIANYYIAFMICIFLIFLTSHLIIENNKHINPHLFVKKYYEFIKSSLIAALMSSFVIIPAYSSLKMSKITHYTQSVNFKPIYNSSEIFSKLFIGAFNIEEIKYGSPIIYSGLLISFFVISYFLNKKIDFREKLSSLFIILLFIVSFYFEFISKYFHGGQLPIWYPFRYSFIFSFFLITISVKAYINFNRKDKSPLFIYSVFYLLLLLYYYNSLSSFSYLSLNKLLISLAFMYIYLVILYIPNLSFLFRGNIILFILSIEVLINASLTLNNFQFVDQTNLENYNSLLNDSLLGLRNTNNDFYRIHKDFMRTKNESFYGNYNGMNHFGSTLESKSSELLGYLGQPVGQGYTVYQNGTPFLNDFFNIKYLIKNNNEALLNPFNLNDSNLNYSEKIYSKVDINNKYTVFENNNRFGLGFEVKTSILDQKNLLHKNDPIENQVRLLNLIDFTNQYPTIFTQITPESTTMNNINIINSGDGDYYHLMQQDDSKDGIIDFIVRTKDDNPYYMTLPSQFNSKNISLSINDNPMKYYMPFKNRQLIDLTFNSNKLLQNIKIVIQNKQIKTNRLLFYEFNIDKYNDLLKNNSQGKLDILSFSNTKITGKIESFQDYSMLLFTIPFDKNWKVTIDNKPTTTYSVLNDTLLAVPLNKGIHKVKLEYKPKSVIIGIVFSCLGLLCYFIQFKFDCNNGILAIHEAKKY